MLDKEELWDLIENYAWNYSDFQYGTHRNSAYADMQRIRSQIEDILNSIEEVKDEEDY